MNMKLTKLILLTSAMVIFNNCSTSPFTSSSNLNFSLQDLNSYDIAQLDKTRVLVSFKSKLNTNLTNKTISLIYLDDMGRVISPTIELLNISAWIKTQVKADGIIVERLNPESKILVTIRPSIKANKNLFQKSLHINALDYEHLKNNKTTKLWHSQISTLGPNDNLEKSGKVLAAFFGQAISSSAKEQSILLSIDDPKFLITKDSLNTIPVEDLKLNNEEILLINRGVFHD